MPNLGGAIFFESLDHLSQHFSHLENTNLTDSVTVADAFSAAAPAIDRSVVAAEVAAVVGQSGIDLTAAGAGVG